MKVNSIEKVKVKKLTANAALTAHIQTREKSILTYADNVYNCLKVFP